MNCTQKMSCVKKTVAALALTALMSIGTPAHAEMFGEPFQSAPIVNVSTPASAPTVQASANAKTSNSTSAVKSEAVSAPRVQIGTSVNIPAVRARVDDHLWSEPVHGSIEPLQ